MNPPVDGYLHRAQVVTGSEEQWADSLRKKLNWSQFATSSHVVHSSACALTFVGGRMDETTSRELAEPLILTVRNRRVILDAQLARLYGLTTKRFNEAFKRNRNRFPADFAFQMSQDDFESLRSQIATSKQAHCRGSSRNMGR